MTPKDLGALCDQCPLNGRRWVLPKTNKRAKMIVIGEAPGRDEEIEGAFFIGRSGKLLDKIFQRRKIPRAKLHTTNALLCRPPRDLTPPDYRKALRCCRPRLQYELNQVRSKTILGLGAKALQSITGKAKIFSWIGAPLNGDSFNPKGLTAVRDIESEFTGYKILPTLHPAFCLRSPAYTPVLEIHIARAWDLANKCLPEWTWPTTIVEPGKIMQGALKDLLFADSLAFDIETNSKDPFNCKLFNVGFSSLCVGVSVPWEEKGIKQEKALALRILRKQSISKTAQNGQYDVIGLEVKGIPVRGFSFDTLIAHHVVAPQLKHSLAFQCAVEFHAPRWKDTFHNATDDTGAMAFIKADPTERAIYNVRDCYMTELLKSILRTRLKQTHNGLVLFDEYMQLNQIATEMRWNGIQVDRSKFARHRKNLGARKRKALKDIQEIATDLNLGLINPHKQADTKRIYDRLRVRYTRISEKTGNPSFNANALLVFTAHPDDRVADVSRAYLRFRRFHKLSRTYITGLPMDSNDVVHASWKPYQTKTGRWACRDPNLMNIPKPKYRKAFNGKWIIAAPGLRDIFRAKDALVLVECDYSQLEARILALIAGDVTLLDWYAKDIDVHTRTAQTIMGVDKPTSTQRDLAKRARYAMHYGSSPETAWRALVVDYPLLALSDIKRLFKEFKRLHPDVIRWQQGQIDKARIEGFVEGPLSGRRHYFYGQVEPSKCYDLPIQISAADVINPAAIRLAKRLNKQERILLQIHDSLVCEGPDRNRLIALMREEMEREVVLNGKVISFPVDIKTGSHWGELKEYRNA